jgi:hypothetical protein
MLPGVTRARGRGRCLPPGRDSHNRGGNLRSIDIHARLMPHCMLQALYREENWHGATGEVGAQGQMVYGPGGRRRILSSRFTWNTAQRLADMDSLGEKREAILWKNLERLLGI